MPTDPTPHLFWITSRAAGIAALVLASLAVSLGLLMSTRLAGRRVSGPDLRALHEALSLSTMAALVVHALALLGDAYLHPSLLDVTVPFVSATIALGLSYYARRRIGQARWRTLHRFTALAWLLGLVHALGEGTDAGQAWFLAMIAIVVVPALGLLATRLGGAGRRREHSDPGRGRPAGPVSARAWTR